MNSSSKDVISEAAGDDVLRLKLDKRTFLRATFLFVFELNAFFLYSPESSR